MPSNKRIWAAKVGYIIISILIGVLGIVLIAVPNFSVSLLCRLGGGILILFGIVKIIGYCSNDLYRLAFQYDLAIGILLIALGAILILRTRIMTSLICVLLGIYTLADAAFENTNFRRFKSIWHLPVVADPRGGDYHRRRWLSAGFPPVRKRTDCYDFAGTGPPYGRCIEFHYGSDIC